VITLKNDFHRSEVRLRAEEGEPFTDSQIRRARRTLCGVQGCVCGGAMGERGPQDVEIEDDPGTDRPYWTKKVALKVDGKGHIQPGPELRCIQNGHFSYEEAARRDLDEMIPSDGFLLVESWATSPRLDIYHTEHLDHAAAALYKLAKECGREIEPSELVVDLTVQGCRESTAWVQAAGPRLYPSSACKSRAGSTGATETD